ncbi:hypothetical protein DFH07DRAFT_1030080 [Mycena maculata]|uniref:DUF6533 domain-containing protein n=1 Tax=Mycena maculata TaxID=230809 RepID=A0AAD7K8X0_9AGAR|nr:hypothetical protein DFH07DRAFT_1030080 [Mycena maculata]
MPPCTRQNTEKLTVVVTYDHVLTLPSEVSYIWAPRLKRSAAWFLLVRYLAFLGNLALSPYFLADLSPESYLLVIQETFVEVTLAVRVCAMYGFNKRVFASLAVAAVITISLGAINHTVKWAIVGPETTINVTIPGCHVPTSHTEAIRKSFVILLRPGKLTPLWALPLHGNPRLTLRRAYTYKKTAGLGSGSLIVTMVRDGAAYFGMIGLVNLANILMLYIITAGSLAWFASTISVTMATRLMLNLHDAANGNWTTPTWNSSAQETDLISSRRRREELDDSIGGFSFQHERAAMGTNNV